MSAGSAKFFKLEKFPNAMKHKIVGGYLKGALYALMLGLRKDVWYADLFAGAGRYEDGRPGSPLIVAELAQERLQQGEQPLIHCFNVERDPAIFALLEANTAHIDRRIIDNRVGDWTDHLDELLMLTQPTRSPLVLFLDPFGLEGIELGKLVQILSGIGSEAREMILTFNVGGMQRMVAAEAAETDPAKRERYYRLPDRVFGSTAWRAEMVDGLLPDAALPRLVAQYEQQLLTTGGSGFQRIVTSVGVPQRIGGPDAYFLVFVTRSTAGLWKMNESVNLALERAWLEEEAQYLLPEAVTGQPRYADRVQQFEAALPAEVLAFLRTRPFGTTIDHLYVDVALRHFGRFRMTHLGTAIRALRKDGLVATNPKRLEPATCIKLAQEATSTG